MDPMQLLKMHGEKAGIAVVALLCGWSIYGTFTDPDIRPKGVSQRTMTEQIDLINQRMNSSEAPQFKPPKAYSDEMHSRFARSMPRFERISWLMAHPDIGGNGSGIFFYVYDLYPPKLKAVDNIGQVILNLGLADATNGGDNSGASRHTAGADPHWSRDSEKGQILNHASIAGLLVDMKVGNQPWRPLNQGDVKEGFISRASLDHTGSIKFISDATWQPVWFRARAVLVATGFTGDVNGDNTVLVHDGGSEDPANWDDLDRAVKSDAAAFLKNYLAPADADVPPTVTLHKGEHAYFSPWYEPDPVMITAKVRFALEKVGSDGSVGEFRVSKQFQTQQGNRWLDKPELFKVKIGDMLGGKRDVHPPNLPEGMVAEEDLSTPFRLKSIERGKECIWYYEIRAKTAAVPADAPAGTRPHHVLDVNPRKHQVDVATLENTQTGETIEVAKLETIPRPVQPDAIYVPVVHGKEYNELTEFMHSPAGLIQRDMHPPAPQWMDPNDPKGPLAKLHASERPLAPVATTTVPYLLLSDGRIVWYNEDNHQVFQDPPQPADTYVHRGTPPAPTPTHQAPTPGPSPRHEPRQQPGAPPPGVGQQPAGAPPWAQQGGGGGAGGANGPPAGYGPNAGTSGPPAGYGPPGGH